MKYQLFVNYRQKCKKLKVNKTLNWYVKHEHFKIKILESALRTNLWNHENVSLV